MQDLILFGMQGSGKGTQGQLLAKQYELEMFETGGQLRKLAAEDSELGRKVKEITTAGKLVPNEVVMEIVENFLKNLPEDKHAIFDGIPRSEEQRVSLEAEFAKVGRRPIAVYIKLEEDEALKRLLGRKICSKCKAVYGVKDNLAEAAVCLKCGGELITRADDTEEAIRTRLKLYAEQTIPAIRQYEKEGRLIEVDGEQEVELVTSDIVEALRKYEN